MLAPDLEYISGSKTMLKKKYAFLGSILYLFAPYHLVDLHFRAVIGEITALMFLPFCFYFLDLHNSKRNALRIFIAALSIAFLIMSHPAISLLGFPLLVAYSLLISKKDVKNQIKSLLPHFLALLISSYYWLPTFVEGKFTQQVFQVQVPFSYPSFQELLFSTWQYGFLFQGPHGELSYVLGYVLWIIIVFAIYLIFIKRNANRFIYFFLSVFLLYLFLILKISSPIWESIATLRKMQFSYRLLSILIFSSSALGAFVAKKFNNIFLNFILISAAILLTILNWGNRQNIPEIGDRQLQEDMPLSASKYAAVTSAMPVWRPENDVWVKTVPVNHLDTLTGEIQILQENRNILDHLYLIDAKEESLLKENTDYYPGWNLTVDGEPQPIIFTNENYPGIITFDISKGKHIVNLTFSDTPVRYYSFLITDITLIFLRPAFNPRKLGKTT